MKNVFNVEELREYIKEGKFVEGDKIYCKEYAVLIYEPSNEAALETGDELDSIICYYADRHDLYSDGTVKDLVNRNKDCVFSNTPIIDLNEEV